jgi:hypothetical protein
MKQTAGKSTRFTKAVDFFCNGFQKLCGCRNYTRSLNSKEKNPVMMVPKAWGPDWLPQN